MKTGTRWWSLPAAVCGVVWAGCGGPSEIEAVELGVTHPVAAQADPGEARAQ